MRPIRILNDMLVKVESFIFPADFVIFDCEVDLRCLLFLGGHSLRQVAIGLHGKRADKVQVEELRRNIKHL